MINIFKEATEAQPLVGTEARTLYNGGLPEGFDFDTLDPLRQAVRQSADGHDFGGFYMSENPQFSANYARENNGTLNRINLADDLNIKLYDDNITRVERGTLQKLIDEGYDMVQGRNPSGRTEYILLNPRKILSAEPMDWRAVLGKMGKNFGKVLPMFGDAATIYDSYKQSQQYQDPYYWWGA